MRKILKYVIIYLIFIFSFIIMLCFASSISKKYIIKNVTESSQTLFKEGNRKKIYIPYKGYIMEFDNFTDALMINTAYSIDSSTPLYSAFVARKNYIPNETTKVFEDSIGELKSASKYEYHNEVGELNDLVNGEINESYEYGRYWHGYLTILRPLLVILNLAQIRIFFAIIIVILAIILLTLIWKKIDKLIAIIFFISLVGVEYFYINFSLQGIFVFLIMMISSIILIRKYKKNEEYGLLFFTVGMLTNFFDFLTVPIITLFVPLTLYILLEQKNKEQLITILKRMFFCILNWGIAYGLTWLTKWILIDLIYQKSIISVSINQIFYRSSFGIEAKNYNLLKVYFVNLKHIIETIIISLIVTYFIGFYKTIFNKHKNNKFNIIERLFNAIPYMILLLVPFFWYGLVQNHSYYHAFFTYRNLIIFNICLNIVIIKLFFETYKENINE